MRKIKQKKLKYIDVVGLVVIVSFITFLLINLNNISTDNDRLVTFYNLINQCDNQGMVFDVLKSTDENIVLECMIATDCKNDSCGYSIERMKAVNVNGRWLFEVV